jgi:hypothetical protein
MDFHWAFIVTFVIAFIVTAILSILKMWNQAILTFILMFILLGNLKHLLNFSISITADKLVVKKLFICIPYLTINQHFDKVLYNEKIPILYFQFKQDRVEIEKFEGFEVDCLLIEVDNKMYELGDKNDADLIFKFIINGLDELKVQKTNADIGYVAQPS